MLLCQCAHYLIEPISNPRYSRCVAAPAVPRLQVVPPGGWAEESDEELIGELRALRKLLQRLDRVLSRYVPDETLDTPTA